MQELTSILLIGIINLIKLYYTLSSDMVYIITSFILSHAVALILLTLTLMVMLNLVSSSLRNIMKIYLAMGHMLQVPEGNKHSKCRMYIQGWRNPGGRGGRGGIEGAQAP